MNKIYGCVNILDEVIPMREREFYIDVMYDSVLRGIVWRPF